MLRKGIWGMDFFTSIMEQLRFATVLDALDILIVAAFIYWVIKLMRNTSAARILKGVLVLLVFMQISSMLELRVINFLLSNVLQFSFLALVVVFQPELRKLLEQFGRSRLRLFKTREVDKQGMQLAILQTVEAASSMSWSKTGALIVFEKEDNISSISKTGTRIDSEVSAELLKNIFFHNAPLHDGAVVISNARIEAAGCLLPLSTNLNISKELGTRHRAAVGMSENFDSPCVVVSEETGSISFAVGGILKRHLAPETLERLLVQELIPQEEENESPSFWERVRGLFK